MSSTQGFGTTLRRSMLLHREVALGLLCALVFQWMLDGFGLFETGFILLRSLWGGNLDFLLAFVWRLMQDFTLFFGLGLCFSILPKRFRFFFSLLFFLLLSFRHSAVYPPAVLMGHVEGNPWLTWFRVPLYWAPNLFLFAMLVGTLFYRQSAMRLLNSSRNFDQAPGQLAGAVSLRSRKFSLVVCLLYFLWFFFPRASQSFDQLQDVPPENRVNFSQVPQVLLVLPNFRTIDVRQLFDSLSAETRAWLEASSTRAVHEPSVSLEVPMRRSLLTGVNSLCSGEDGNWGVNWTQAPPEQLEKNVESISSRFQIVSSQGSLLSNWLWRGQANAQQWTKEYFDQLFFSINPLFASVFEDRRMRHNGLAVVSFEDAIARLADTIRKSNLDSSQRLFQFLIVDLPPWNNKKSLSAQSADLDLVRNFAQELKNSGIGAGSVALVGLPPPPQSFVYSDLGGSLAAGSDQTGGPAVIWEKGDFEQTQGNPGDRALGSFLAPEAWPVFDTECLTGLMTEGKNFQCAKTCFGQGQFRLRAWPISPEESLGSSPATMLWKLVAFSPSDWGKMKQQRRWSLTNGNTGQRVTFKTAERLDLEIFDPVLCQREGPIERQGPVDIPIGCLGADALQKALQPAGFDVRKIFDQWYILDRMQLD